MKEGRGACVKRGRLNLNGREEEYDTRKGAGHTAGLAVRNGHTKNQFANEPRGLRQIQDYVQKGSRQGESIGSVTQAPSSFFGKLFMENR